MKFNPISNLKLVMEFLVFVATYIFIRIMELGVRANILKHACILPILKSGDSGCA